MIIEQLLKKERDTILAIADRYGVTNMRVFGSVARGEADAQSDIDFVVTLQKDWSLLEHIAFTQELEDLLGRKVDVVVEEGLRDIIRENVLNEAVPL
jgi:uncharacterized protein